VDSTVFAGKERSSALAELEVVLFGYRVGLGQEKWEPLFLSLLVGHRD